ncbi:MAG: hypothetical protein OYM47_03970 [Gemmatimonadota bacterium]|nr:hypothetical protein [Gemmatimonadota bacterium]
MPQVLDMSCMSQVASIWAQRDTLPISGKEGQIRDLKRKMSSFRELSSRTRAALSRLDSLTLEAIGELRRGLDFLEKNPGEYLALCNGDAKTAIEGMNSGESMAKEMIDDISPSLELFEEFDEPIFDATTGVMDNLQSLAALIREIRWNIIILHRKNEPATGAIHSVDEAIDQLRG